MSSRTPNRLPDRETLLRLFTYEPETGHLRWKVLWRDGKRKVGDVAGTAKKRDGTIQVTIERRAYRAHRIIWKMLHGTEPPEIDHRDGNPGNNRVNNLRAADRPSNTRNRRVQSNNSLGLKGVRKTTWGRFRAQIGIAGGKRLSLGYFDTPQEAHAAYVAEARRLYGDFANAG